MVSNQDYVAGWLNSSVHDFFQTFPPVSESMKYVLITCLDSDLEPKSLLKKSPELRPVAALARPLGKGILLPTQPLLQAESLQQLFVGFDEVWFFPDDQVKPKPHSAWLVGPARVDQKKLDKLAVWMAANSCALALGDGEGLNFITKARGLVKYLLGHSIDQPKPEVTFMASPARGVAG